MSRVLSFSDPSDSRLGFLSNRSKHSFVIDGRRWHTVEHYIQGQRFRGTQMEGRIREASTIFQMKNLLKVRTVTVVTDGIVVKKKVYGDRRSMYKPVSINVYETMVVAIRAKFKQSKRLADRLIRTAGMRLKDTSNPLTGKALEQVRAELMPETSIDTSLPIEDTWDWKTDVDSPQLSQLETSFVNGYTTALSILIKAENADGIYPEMFYDVIANVCSSRATVRRYCLSIRDLDWTWAYSNTPNFCQIVYECRLLIGKSCLPKKALKQDSNIAALIRWYRLYRKKELQRAIKKLQRLNVDNIKLGKGIRAYRDKLSIESLEIVKPPPITVQKKSVQKQPVAINIQSSTDYIQNTSFTEPPPPKRAPRTRKKKQPSPPVIVPVQQPVGVAPQPAAPPPQPIQPPPQPQQPIQQQVEAPVKSISNIQETEEKTPILIPKPAVAETSPPQQEQVPITEESTESSCEGWIVPYEKPEEIEENPVMDDTNEEEEEDDEEEEDEYPFESDIDMEKVKADPRFIKAMEIISVTQSEKEMILADIEGMLSSELEEMYSKISKCDDPVVLRDIFML